MVNKKLNRRDFLRLGSLVAGGAVLASCAPQTEEPMDEPMEDAAPDVEEAPEMAETVTVQYWYAWGNLDPAMDKILETDEFKEAMKGNSLEY